MGVIPGTCGVRFAGSERMHEMGFAILLPTLTGSLILLLIALLNNFVPGRKYPVTWF